MEFFFGLVIRIGIAAGVAGSLLLSLAAQPIKTNIAALEAKVAAAHSDTARATALTFLAVSLWDVDPPRSLACSQEALGLAVRAGNLQIQGKALNSMGVVYGFVGSYELAAEHFFKALRVRELAGDVAGIASTLNNIGVLYMRQKMYKEALLKYVYIEENFKYKNNVKNRMNTLINIAKIYNDILLPDSTLFYIRKVRSLSDSIGVPITDFSLYHVEAQAFFLKEAYSQSLEAYQLLERRFDSLSMPDQNITLAGMSNIYI